MNILSIQSHVTHGFVGNKAATFPLQCLGWNVDVINSVNFSNHTGYGSVEGSVMDPDMVLKIYNQLDSLKIADYQCFLTGYIPNKAFLNTVFQIGAKIKEKNPHTLWLLDPVMGDEGVLYVDKSVVEAYRSGLKSKCVDIITPNQYEMELLVGFPVNTESSMRKALKLVHDEFDISFVVITSIYFDENPGVLCSVRSVKDETGKYTVKAISPVIDGYFTGVGDIFSALLIDKIFKNTSKEQATVLSVLDKCVDATMDTMSKILRTTLEVSNKAMEKDGVVEQKGEIGSLSMKYHELAIIQCAKYFH